MKNLSELLPADYSESVAQTMFDDQGTAMATLQHAYEVLEHHYDATERLALRPYETRYSMARSVRHMAYGALGHEVLRRAMLAVLNNEDQAFDLQLVQNNESVWLQYRENSPQTRFYSEDGDIVTGESIGGASIGHEYDPSTLYVLDGATTMLCGASEATIQGLVLQRSSLWEAVVQGTDSHNTRWQEWKENGGIGESPYYAQVGTKASWLTACATNITLVDWLVKVHLQSPEPTPDHLRLMANASNPTRKSRLAKTMLETTTSFNDKTALTCPAAQMALSKMYALIVRNDVRSGRCGANLRLAMVDPSDIEIAEEYFAWSGYALPSHDKRFSLNDVMLSFVAKKTKEQE